MAECNHDCENCGENCAERDLSVNPHKDSHIKKTIAIVSGKGGVGKSFVTSILAITKRREGKEVAILDGDVTGPSIPKMFGIKGSLEGDQNGIYPATSKTGIKIVSTNLLLENESDPIIWRGSLISNMVKQFYTDVIYGDVDYLFIDMPPGTGDVPLTVFQSIKVDGIIIVTTPQDLVGMIVEKAINMANMMNVNILGIVENMSYVICDKCDNHINVFGESHVEDIAEQYGLKVLAKLPINPKNVTLIDQGKIEDLEDISIEL